MPDGYGGNIFGIVGAAMKDLRRAKMADKAKELAGKVQECKSYDEACALVDKYLDMIPDKDPDQEWDEYWAEQDGK
jgi:hypothetical protein